MKEPTEAIYCECEKPMWRYEPNFFRLVCKTCNKLAKDLPQSPTIHERAAQSVEALIKPDMASMLTKREWFAGMALMGLNANTSTQDGNDASVKYVAETAVRQADALIAKLGEKV